MSAHNDLCWCGMCDARLGSWPAYFAHRLICRFPPHPDCLHPDACAAKWAPLCGSCNTKRQHADPVFRRKVISGIRRHHGGDPDNLSLVGRTEYKAARTARFGNSDAMDLARDAEAMEGA